jgi:hypothetical protein
MGASIAAMPSARTLLIELTILAGLGVFLALLGPFGSFQAGLADRLFYWLGLGLGGFVLFRPAMTSATALAHRLDLPEGPSWVAACLFAAVPMSLIVWFLSPERPNRLPSGAEWLSAYANVAIVAAGVTLVFWFVSAPERRAQAARPAPPPPAAREAVAPRFLERLPPHLGRDLLALEMEDHYVRAHTQAGSALILMRMRDAVAELDGLDGQQVHRSWWVARSALVRAVQDGRNVRLLLRNGVEAPVARNSQAALRDAGWW